MYGSRDNRARSPYYTCSVWTGYDNNVSLRTKNPGKESDISKVLWRSIMSRIHENLPNEKFAMPAGIVRGQVCTVSGLAPIAGLCETRGEYFAEGTVPEATCNIHYMGNVCNYDRIELDGKALPRSRRTRTARRHLPPRTRPTASMTPHSSRILTMLHSSPSSNGKS